MSWNGYNSHQQQHGGFQAGGRGAGGNNSFRGAFMQQGQSPGNQYGARGGHNFRGGYRQGERTDFYVNDEVVGAGSNFPARKAPPAHAGNPYNNYGGGAQHFIPPQAHGGYGGPYQAGYGYGLYNYGNWGDYAHPGYTTQQQQQKEPAKSGSTRSKAGDNEHDQRGPPALPKREPSTEENAELSREPLEEKAAALGVPAVLKPVAAIEPHHSLMEHPNEATRASEAKKPPPASQAGGAPPPSPTASTTSSSALSPAGATSPPGQGLGSARSVTPTNGNSRRKQSTPHKVPGSSTMNIITQKGIPLPPDSPRIEHDSTKKYVPGVEEATVAEVVPNPFLSGIGPLRGIAANLETLKKEAKTTGSSEGDFADKESDDEAVVKEKATVRKKRVSRAEAKGEESDSSDLDLKEAATKTSPPKSSRSPRLTRTGGATTSPSSGAAKTSGEGKKELSSLPESISPEPPTDGAADRPQVAAIPKLKKEAETPPQRRRSKGEMKEFPGEASSQADSPSKKGSPPKGSQISPDKTKPVTRQSPKKEVKEVYRKMEEDLEAMFAGLEDDLPDGKKASTSSNNIPAKDPERPAEDSLASFDARETAPVKPEISVPDQNPSPVAIKSPKKTMSPEKIAPPEIIMSLEMAPSMEKVALNDQKTLPEQEMSQEKLVSGKRVASTDKEASSLEKMTVGEKIPKSLPAKKIRQEKRPLPEKKPPMDKRPLPDKRSLSEKRLSSEKRSLPEKKPVSEKKPLPGKNTPAEKRASLEKEPAVDLRPTPVKKLFEESTPPPKAADLPDPVAGLLERKSPRLKRQCARDAEMRMREDPSDEVEEILKDQTKVAYRPDPKREPAAGLSSSSRGGRQQVAQPLAIDEAGSRASIFEQNSGGSSASSRSGLKQEAPASSSSISGMKDDSRPASSSGKKEGPAAALEPGQSMMRPTSGRRAATEAAGCVPKKENSDGETVIKTGIEAVAAVDESKQLPGPTTTPTTAVTRPRRGAGSSCSGGSSEPPSAAVTPTVVGMGVIKGPVDETAVSDKDETEAVPVVVDPLVDLLPGNNSSCRREKSPPVTSATGERKTRRSRSSLGDVDPPKESPRKIPDVTEIISPEAGLVGRSTRKRRQSSAAAVTEVMAATASEVVPVVLEKKPEVAPDSSAGTPDIKKQKLASPRLANAKTCVENGSRAKRLSSQQGGEQQPAPEKRSDTGSKTKDLQSSHKAGPSRPSLGAKEKCRPDPPSEGETREPRPPPPPPPPAGRKGASKPETVLERLKGPYVHIEGDVRSPRTVLVVNSNADIAGTSSTNKRGICDQEHRARVANYGYSSTLSKQYDYKIVDNTWRCVFCHQKPHYKCLGDLFGPYWVPADCFKTPAVEVPKRAARKSGKSVTADGESAAKQYQQASVQDGEVEIWFHEDCFCWVPNVYLVGSRIVGMREAVELCSSTRCCVCSEYGASLGCTRAGCRNAAHVPCTDTAAWRTDVTTFSATCSACH